MQSYGSAGSNASSGSNKSRKSLRSVLSRITSNKSERTVRIAKEQRDKKSATVTEDDHKTKEEDNAKDLLQDEKDAWEHHTVLLLGGRQSDPMTQLSVLKALMSEIKKLEVRNNANSSFDSPLILCGRSRREEKSESLPGAAPNETNASEDACYLPCHYFDFAGGASTGGLIAILLGRLRMTVDEAIVAYEDLIPIQQKQNFPVKRRAPYSEEDFRSRLDTAVKRPMTRLPGTMVKDAPISTKLASSPYMCKTFLRSDAGSKIDLSTCNSDDRREEEIIDAACEMIIQPKKTWVLRSLHRELSLRGGKAVPKHRETNLRKAKSPKSDFLMSISRMSPKREDTGQVAETHSLERFSRNDMPNFMQGIDFDFGADILSLLEKNESTDPKAASWLKQVKKCAKYLVEKRQRRAQTANWERFALGTDYRCGYCAAKGRDKTYDQYLLIEHLQKEHRAPPSDDDRFDTYCEILRHFRTVAVA